MDRRPAAVVPPPDIALWTGTEALNRSSDPTFLTESTDLARRCPWATPFQGPRLLHYGWLGGTKVTLSEVGQVLEFPQTTAVLHDFYTVPDARNRDRFRGSVAHLLRELARAGVRRAVIGILADNTLSRRVVEELGFRHAGSLWRRRQCGRTTKWSTAEQGRVTGQ